MTGNEKLLAAAFIATLSGSVALLADARRNIVQKFAVGTLVAANLCGLAGLWDHYSGRAGDSLRIASPIGDAELVLGVDDLSAFFLIPLLVVTALAAVYSLEYWRAAEHPHSARRITFFLGSLAGGMIILLLARDGLSFLTGWEMMALSAFFCVGAEDDVLATRRAAWLYLSLSHLATLALFAMFAAMAAATGSYEWTELPAAAPQGAMILALAFFGFGVKAGLMPLHVWLPSAHAQAPSHISAIMSGIVIKMGVYGMMRITSLVDDAPPVWGGGLLAVGVVSAVLGVAYAISQRDVKRIFAYSSIENIGIVAMGLGLALLGRSLDRPAWVVLGIGGALLHVWNHAAFKSLLFFAAGAIVHATGTRNTERLGGLAKRMPRVAVCFFVAAVAICGLPPLNGFVSEWLIYLGFFDAIRDQHDHGSGVMAALAAPGLAMTGALAVACFVRVFGIVFLGAPRSESAAHAHECGVCMYGPMYALAGVCVLLGVVPSIALTPLQAVVAQWGGAVVAGESLGALAPLRTVGWVSTAVLLAVIGGALALRKKCAAATAPRGLTWDCGYAAPSPRMQYTASSFGATAAGLFGWALRPHVHAPRLTALFPADGVYRSRWADVALQKAVLPLTRGVVWLLSWARYLQQGSIHAYLLYMLAIIVFLLAWK